MRVRTGLDGTFVFHNIPRGPYCVFVICDDPKWHLSSKNRSFPYDNAQCLVGNIPRDKEDLIILLDQSEAVVVQHRAEDDPMHGIEQKPGTHP
ncbi:MAG: hypothetical protein ABUL63_01285 [Acidobacteriota bacterium]